MNITLELSFEWLLGLSILGYLVIGLVLARVIYRVCRPKCEMHIDKEGLKLLVGLTTPLWPFILFVFTLLGTIKFFTWLAVLGYRGEEEEEK